MERIVKNGAVYVGGNKYRHPLLRRINGCVVGVAFRQSSDEVIDVFSPGGFYCSAVCEGKNTTSPMKPTEKGRLERLALKRTRQSGVYVSMEDVLRREVRRTDRACRQLSQPTKAGQYKFDVRLALINIRDGLDALINYLDE